MNTITTKLVPDGNSMAVRIPKQALVMSGLAGVVQLIIKSGQITIRMPQNPRAGWEKQIDQEIASHGPISAIDDYGDMDAENEATLVDGIEQ